MDTKVKVGLGIGAGVIALGAAVGVGALAANLAGGSNQQAQPGYGQGGGGGQGGRGGFQGRGGFDTTQLASTLAEKLGVDQAKVEAALQEVMASSRPSGMPSDRPSGMPSGQPTARPSFTPGSGQNGRGGQYLETLAKGLAEKLGVDESKVLAALQEAMQDRGGQPSGQSTP